MNDQHNDNRDPQPDATSEPAGSAGETPEVLNVGMPGGRRMFLRTLSQGAAGATAAAAAASCDKSSSTQTSPTNPSGPAGTSTSTTTAVRTYTLAGYVTDRSARPVRGARVFVADGPNANKFSNTDDNGYYSIPGLVSGGFTLTTSFNGVALYSQGVTLLADMRLDFAVTTTSTTTTSTSTVAQQTSSVPGGGGSSHYWYPN